MEGTGENSRMERNNNLMGTEEDSAKSRGPLKSFQNTYSAQKEDQFLLQHKKYEQFSGRLILEGVNHFHMYFSAGKLICTSGPKFVAVCCLRILIERQSKTY